ncbi:MAG: hypothetical protein WCG06_01325, partial [Candidatus Omnitrophota bacterium]
PEAFFGADSVEGGSTAAHSGESRFHVIAQAAYKKFFEEYARKFKTTRHGRPLNRQEAHIGHRFGYLDLECQSEKALVDNRWWMASAVSYSDKETRRVGRLRLVDRLSAAEAPPPLDGIHPLSYEDVLDAAAIKQPAVGGKPYWAYLVRLRTELSAAEYNWDDKGGQRRHMSIGFYKEGRLLGYAVAYIGFNRKTNQEFILLSDFAVLDNDASVRRALIAALCREARQTADNFGRAYPKKLGGQRLTMRIHNLPPAQVEPWKQALAKNGFTRVTEEGPAVNKDLAVEIPPSPAAATSVQAERPADSAGSRLADAQADYHEDSFEIERLLSEEALSLHSETEVLRAWAAFVNGDQRFAAGVLPEILDKNELRLIRRRTGLYPGRFYGRTFGLKEAGRRLRSRPITVEAVRLIERKALYKIRLAFLDYLEGGLTPERIGEIRATSPPPKKMKLSLSVYGQESRAVASVPPGYGFTHRLSDAAAIYRKQLLRDMRKTAEQKGLKGFFADLQLRALADAVVRISRESLDQRRSLFEEGDVEHVAIFRPFDAGFFLDRILTEEAKYKKAEFSDIRIRRLLFRKLIPFAWARTLMRRGGLNRHQAFEILLRSANPLSKWETDFKPFRDHLVGQDGLAQGEANQVILYLRGRSQGIEAQMQIWNLELKPIRDQIITRYGIPPGVATQIVLHRRDSLQFADTLDKAAKKVMQLPQNRYRYSLVVTRLFWRSPKKAEKWLRAKYRIRDRAVFDDILSGLKAYRENHAKVRAVAPDGARAATAELEDASRQVKYVVNIGAMTQDRITEDLLGRYPEAHVYTIEPNRQRARAVRDQLSRNRRATVIKLRFEYWTVPAELRGHTERIYFLFPSGVLLGIPFGENPFEGIARKVSECLDPLTGRFVLVTEDLQYVSYFSAALRAAGLEVDIQKGLNRQQLVALVPGVKHSVVYRATNVLETKKIRDPETRKEETFQLLIARAKVTDGARLAVLSPQDGDESTNVERVRHLRIQRRQILAALMSEADRLKNRIPPLEQQNYESIRERLYSLWKLYRERKDGVSVIDARVILKQIHAQAKGDQYGRLRLGIRRFLKLRLKHIPESKHPEVALAAMVIKPKVEQPAAVSSKAPVPAVSENVFDRYPAPYDAPTFEGPLAPIAEVLKQRDVRVMQKRIEPAVWVYPYGHYFYVYKPGGDDGLSDDFEARLRVYQESVKIGLENICVHMRIRGQGPDRVAVRIAGTYWIGEVEDMYTRAEDLLLHSILFGNIDFVVSAKEAAGVWRFDQATDQTPRYLLYDVNEAFRWPVSSPHPEAYEADLPRISERFKGIVFDWGYLDQRIGQLHVSEPVREGLKKAQLSLKRLRARPEPQAEDEKAPAGVRQGPRRIIGASIVQKIPKKPQGARLAQLTAEEDRKLSPEFKGT